MSEEPTMTRPLHLWCEHNPTCPPLPEQKLEAKDGSSVSAKQEVHKDSHNDNSSNKYGPWITLVAIMATAAMLYAWTADREAQATKAALIAERAERIAERAELTRMISDSRNLMMSDLNNYKVDVRTHENEQNATLWKLDSHRQTAEINIDVLRHIAGVK